ncbi:MAG: DUF6151 family protein [Myxococcota bacterium]
MPEPLPIQCTCGALRGIAKDVTPKRVTHLVCMCDDCQTYAHWLGRADEILDPHGGTEVVQMTPRMVEFTEGQEHLHCVRLSPKGLMRWYSSCCKTPIANTLNRPKLPFSGLVHLALRQGDAELPVDRVGPIRSRVNGRFGHGDLPEGSHPRAPFGVVASAVVDLFTAFVRRDHKPTPFFDLETGEPVVEPTVISKEERNRCRALLGPIEA